MADIKWIKITVDIFDDEKIRLIDSMPDRDAIIVIWFKMLTLAGKKNDSGLIYLSDKVAYTDEMLATIFNRPLNTVRLALSVFKNFGMIEISGDYIITLVNWEKHQNIEGMEKIRIQNNERQKRHREKSKLQLAEVCNVMSRDSNAIDKNKNKNKNKNIYTRASDLCKAEPDTIVSPVIIPYQDIMKAWNNVMPEMPIRSMSKARKDAIKARWHNEKDEDGTLDMQSVDRWIEFFKYIRESEFLMGTSGQWKCCFDWVIKAGNFLKIREGNYHK